MYNSIPRAKHNPRPSLMIKTNPNTQPPTHRLLKKITVTHAAAIGHRTHKAIAIKTVVSKYPRNDHYVSVINNNKNICQRGIQLQTKGR